MRSWDIFDTLIGRRCFDNRGIFAIMAQRIGSPEFADIRARADQMSPGLDAIYDNVAAMTGLAAGAIEHLKALELEVEKEQAYLIPETYDQVEPGDLLITDMYLGRAGIEAILARVGFAKPVTLYVASHGKMNGTIWPLIKSHGHTPTVHTGDNYHSDVISPTKHGVLGRHYADSQWLPLERAMSDAGYVNLARLMRTVRLMNPYPPQTIPYGMWNEQAQINGPMLYLASLHLQHFHRARHGFTTVVFASRDTCHWYRLFEALFPNQASVYWHASRRVLHEPSSQFVRYMETLTDWPNAVVVDCHGTGRSLYRYFSERNLAMPFCYNISSWGGAAPVIALQKFYALSGSNLLSIERLNYDTVGAMVDFDDNGPVREDPAYDPAHLRPYHRAIDVFTQEAKRSTIDEPGREETLVEMVRMFVKMIHRGTHIEALIDIDEGHTSGTLYEIVRTPL